MRITESKLRKIIRNLIVKSQELNESAAYRFAEKLYYDQMINGGDYQALLNTLTSKHSRAELEAASTEGNLSGVKALIRDALAEPSMNETKYHLMREFGEKDHELRQKLANRDKMIGRGIDGGTIGYDPNHDYDKRPSSRTPKFRAGDVLAQVGHVLENLAKNDFMFDHYEWKPSRNPDVAHITSGGMTVVVKNNRGRFTFKMQKPRAWLGWERECDSVDSEIEDILYDLQDFIDEKESG